VIVFRFLSRTCLDLRLSLHEGIDSKNPTCGTVPARYLLVMKPRSLTTSEAISTGSAERDETVEPIVS
jgi:hypothetical protein